MEITIVACLFTKWNVNINACQLNCFSLIKKYKHITIISFCLLLLGNSLLFANQDSIYILLKTNTELPKMQIPKLIQAESEEQAKTQVSNLISILRNEGYLAASADSFKISNDTLYAYLHIGQAFQHFHLDISNLDPVTKKSIQLPLKDKVQLDWNDWKKLSEKLLQYGENNGYPFSTVQLNQIAVNDSVIHAKVFYDHGKQYTIDSIEIRGTAKINRNYIENYLDLKKGSIYNEQKIAQSNKKLLELPFVKTYRSPAVEFFDNRARLFLFMNDQKVNRFDFLLGILPNTNNSRGSNFQITGEGLLSLTNVFGYGEKFHLEYNNYPNKTRTLKTQIASNYLPLLPLGANFQFNLYINDTLYINRDFEAGILYPLKGNNFIKAFYKSHQSNLLEIDEQKIIDEQRLPDNVDWRRQNYGIALNYEELDYRFNPTKGIKLSLTTSIGSKTILQNLRILQLSIDSVPGFNFSTLYETGDQKFLKYEIGLQFDKYWKISSALVLKTSINSSYLYTSENEKSISESELYRIGGLNTLRGFDEESIFVNWYNILTLEFRYLIGSNSYFSVFGDFAYTENAITKLTAQNYYNIPIGLGAGLNFETSAGIFSLNYALGKQLNNNFNLRSGKIHFGYLNYF